MPGWFEGKAKSVKDSVFVGWVGYSGQNIGQGALDFADGETALRLADQMHDAYTASGGGLNGLGMAASAGAYFFTQPMFGCWDAATGGVGGGRALSSQCAQTAAIVIGPKILLGGRAAEACAASEAISTEIPEVNWAAQERHFLGHPNYLEGRSELTADPGQLLDRAGTGNPVGSVPRGEPGFRERIDFGETIGTYVDPVTGMEAPTMRGILHYGKSGAHIVPSRPGE